MAWFSQKEKNNDKEKPLSEKEIQKKLYGGFFHGQPGGAVKTSSGYSKDFPSRVESQPPAHDHELFDAPESPFDKEEIKPKELPTLDQPPANDFFKNPVSPYSAKGKQQDAASQGKKISSQKNSPAGVSSVLPDFKYSSSRDSRQLSFWDQFSDKFWDGVRLVGGLLMGILFLFDLRKPSVRRLFYWTAGAMFLGALFFGIHQLNVNRENTILEMKTGKTKPEKAVKAAAVEVKPVEPPVETSVTTPLIPAEEKAAEPAPKPAPAVKADPTPSEVETKPYVIQIATYAIQEDAERVVADLKAEGFQGFSKELSRGSGRVYYCVFLGRFKDTAEAYNELNNFRKKTISQPFTDAFVRSLT